MICLLHNQGSNSWLGSKREGRKKPEKTVDSTVDEPLKWVHEKHSFPAARRSYLIEVKCAKERK
jgi:hypothetical protein